MREAADFLRSRQPVNLAMVVVNVAVFLVLSILGNTESASFMLQHGAQYAPYVLQQGEYYRCVTSMFLHFGLLHLFYNMVMLIFLGDMLERLAGKAGYLIVYLGGGIVGNLTSLAVDALTGDASVSAGASGAIFAVIGALVAAVLFNKGKVSKNFRSRLLLMAALSVLQGFSSTGIDNSAHVGGLIAGFLLAFLFRSRLCRAEWEESVDKAGHYF